MQYDPKGKIVREWSKKESANISHSVEVVLDANLAFRHRMPEGIPEVYFACNTVRQKLVQVRSPGQCIALHCTYRSIYQDQDQFSSIQIVFSFFSIILKTDSSSCVCVCLID